MGIECPYFMMKSRSKILNMTNLPNYIAIRARAVIGLKFQSE